MQASDSLLKALLTILRSVQERLCKKVKSQGRHIDTSYVDHRWYIIDDCSYGDDRWSVIDPWRHVEILIHVGHDSF